MSKEMERLNRAFRHQDRVTPEAHAKASSLAAAMDAFDAENFSAEFQGSQDATRLKGQGGEMKPLSKWRRMMETINSKWAYSLAGSASIAVLAMVIVGPNIGDFIAPNDGFETPTENKTVNEPLVITENSDAVVANDKNGGGAQIATPQVVRPGVVVSPPALKRSREVVGSRPAGNSQGLSIQSESFVRVAPSVAPAPIDVTPPTYQDQGRDQFETVDDNPVKLVSEDPVSTFSVDVDTASYAFMRASLNNNVLPPKDAVRVEEFINYFDYAYEAPKDASEPFKANVSIMPTPWNEGTKLMSIGIKGYELERAEAPDANLVFLIDTSGSMNAANKLPLLRNSFKLLLSTLKPTDTISIVAYAGSAGTVLEPTKAADKNKILAALDNLRAGGSTAGGEGIRQAYNLAEATFKEKGVNRVILATDGDFNVGISNPEALKSFVERKRDTGVTLSVLGFGQGNYNDALMQKLAQNGNGNANYIDTLSEARKVLVEEAGSTLFTIAKDVKLQVEFNPAQVSEYRLIGYETRTLAREDFNNDKVDAGDIGAGHTVTALYEITPVGSDAALVDGLRYGNEEVASNTAADEYGFLKIRYKLPDSEVSSLKTRLITKSDEQANVQAASNDARFSASVAAFGQMLRGGQYTGSFTYGDVIALAQSGKGDDEFGYRAEFINLVRLAESAAALQPLKP